MAQAAAVSLFPRFEGLPIIVVFALLLALFMYSAPEVFLRPTSTRRSCRPRRR